MAGRGFCRVTKAFSMHLELQPKPHEILSFIIINSEPFKELYTKSVCRIKVH